MRRKKTPDLHNEALAGSVCTDQEHRERLDRYTRAKRHQLTVIDYIQHDPTLRKEHETLSDCGQYLIFKHWITTGFRKLSGGFSCKKHLLCQCCSLRRDARYAWEYGLKIRKVLEENPHLELVMITLTVKDGLDLLERYNHLGKNNKGLLQRRRDSLKLNTTARVDSVMQYVTGSVGTYEFTIGKNSGEWHPHIHQIAFLEPVFDYSPVETDCWERDEEGEWHEAKRVVYVPQEFKRRLSEEYLQISGDSKIVDVRRIECFDKITGEFSQDLLMHSLCEVFKYALKYGDLSMENQIHAYKVLKGRRLIFTYGCLRGVKIDEYLTDPAKEELEIGPYVYELYSFINRDYQFSKHLDNDEYEEMQATSATKGYRQNLRRREERIADGSSILLENGLRIDAGRIEKHLESRRTEEPVPF